MAKAGKTQPKAVSKRAPARRRARKVAETAERERKRREAHEQAVEAVLQKISDSGIDSLTPGERRVLEEETNRQRSS